MVGGHVSLVIDCEPDVIEVQCVGTGCERYDRTAVKVRKEGRWREIKPGDSLWWQGSRVYWTPKSVREDESDRRYRGGVDFDIPLERRGCSYTPEAK